MKNIHYKPKFIPLEPFDEGVTKNLDGSFIIQKKLTNEELEKSIREDSRKEMERKCG